MVSPSFAVSALHPGAERGSLETGLENNQMVFLAPILLSADHGEEGLQQRKLRSGKKNKEGVGLGGLGRRCFKVSYGKRSHAGSSMLGFDTEVAEISSFHEVMRIGVCLGRLRGDVRSSDGE